MNCKPCTHTQRDRIDADLIRGRPLRAISSEYGCSLGSLSRHRQHVRELIREHVTGDREERGSNLFNRVEKLVGEAEEILASAKSEKNLSCVYERSDCGWQALGVVREIVRGNSCSECAGDPVHAADSCK
jgi:hypothetical protein